MGRRGLNHFKLNDARRALRSARDAGLNPAGIDIIVGKDGSTTFRVYGGSGGMPGVAPSVREPDVMPAASATIAKSKPRTPKPRQKSA